MNQKYFLVPCQSLFKKILVRYFSINVIINGFVNAFFLSFFIILALFDNLFVNFISPFFAIYGFYRLLKSSRIEFFYTGFFVGILWFYWVSFSLRFYGLSIFIPLEILFFGLVYGVLFLICSIPKSKILKTALIVGLSYFYPFNFNWLNLELTLINGIFEPNLRGLIAVMAGVLLLQSRVKLRVILAISAFCAGLQIKEFEPKFLPFSVELTGTMIDQDIKWDKRYKDSFTIENLNTIKQAIDENKSLIILPENAFVTHLNLDLNLMQTLQNLSHQITIVTGALAYENRQSYNSTFVFENGEFQRYDKAILVPFGEEIPLPDFLAKPINKLIFGVSDDFSKANKISEYEIDGIRVTNAICYEATRPEIYKNSPNFVIAITNNGWFMPSTEAVLQRLLIKYYATKSGASVYHSVNGSKSEIITPKKMIIKEILAKFKG
ncbi:MAG: apolipoprotein N-acyltransferase [Campylobacter sp.]|nr:apolipoprotein N-acyltransferase [Campylobacter sp.]